MEKWTRFMSHCNFFFFLRCHAHVYISEVGNDVLSFEFPCFSAELQMYATVACTSFPLCLWSFYICCIKVIFRFVCLSLTQTSVSSIAFDGWISLTVVCENAVMFPQGGTSLLIHFSKLYSPLLGNVTEDMQQSLAAALVSWFMKTRMG